jgi:hypothetical protein
VDGFCRRNTIERIDLLKIDTEGAEHQVLLGARQMLRRKKIGCCVFEFGATTFDMGNDPDAIEAYIQECGYRFRNVVRENPVFPGRSASETAAFSMHVAFPQS